MHPWNQPSPKARRYSAGSDGAQQMVMLANVWRSKGVELREATIRAALAIYCGIILAGWFMMPEPEGLCFTSDVRAICCPSACAAKRGSKWYKADEILRACVNSLGCNDRGATVEGRCSCM